MWREVKLAPWPVGQEVSPGGADRSHPLRRGISVGGRPDLWRRQVALDVQLRVHVLDEIERNRAVGRLRQRRAGGPEVVSSHRKTVKAAWREGVGPYV